MYYEFSPNPMVFLIPRTENNDHTYHAETLPDLIQQALKWLIVAKLMLILIPSEKQQSYSWISLKQLDQSSYIKGQNTHWLGKKNVLLADQHIQESKSYWRDDYHPTRSGEH